MLRSAEKMREFLRAINEECRRQGTEPPLLVREPRFDGWPMVGVPLANVRTHGDKR